MVGNAHAAIFVQDAVFVTGDDVPGAGGQHHFDNGCSGGAGAIEDDFHVFDLFAHHLQGVEQGSSDHDAGAVLVVVEHGNGQLFFQTALDFKAPGRGDVLQIDAAETGGNVLHRADNLLGVLGVQTNGNCVHAAEFLEQHGLALHDGDGGLCADIAKTQHGAAVGDHGDGPSLEGVGVHIIGICMDFPAGLRHAGGIGCAQIVPGFQLDPADSLDFSLMFPMHFQCQFVKILSHSGRPLIFCK